MSDQEFPLLEGVAIEPSLHKKPKLKALYKEILHSPYTDIIPFEVKRLFGNFVNSDEVGAVIREFVETLAKDENYAPRAIFWDGYFVFQVGFYTLLIENVRMNKSEKSILSTEPANSLMAVVDRNSRIKMTKYRLPSDTDLEVFLPGIKVGKSYDTTLSADSGVFEINTGDILDYSASVDSVVARIIQVNSKGFTWAIDKKTMSSSFVSATSPAISRCEMALDLVQRLGPESIGLETSKKVIESFSDHQSHSVRWKAAQCMARLDGENALRMLRTMLDDIHPHIRDASARALGKIY